MTEDRLFVQYINLERSPDREVNIRARLSAAGFDFHKCVGVDGSDLSAEQLSFYDEERAIRYMGRRLFRGEVGCYLSHINAIKAFLETDAEFGLVVEDDLVVPKGFKSFCLDVCDVALRTFPEWQLINLYRGAHRPFSTLAKLQLGDEVHRFGIAHSFPASAVALIWSKRGASDFIEKFNSIYAPFDQITKAWMSNKGLGLGFANPVLTNDAEYSVIKSVENIPQRSTRGFGENLLYDYKKGVRDRRVFFGACRTYLKYHFSNWNF